MNVVIVLKLYVGKQNVLEPCRKGWLLPTKKTIASQDGVIPGWVLPQVVKTRTEKKTLGVLGVVLVNLGMQAFLNPTSGRSISRRVMSWPPNLP